MITYVKLLPSNNSLKKYMVIIDNKTIHFGQQGAEDYTTHKNKKRKELYILRHRPREDWNKSGILKPSFWSKNLLWNLPTINQSKNDIERKFNVVFI